MLHLFRAAMFTMILTGKAVSNRGRYSTVHDVNRCFSRFQLAKSTEIGHTYLGEKAN